MITRRPTGRSGRFALTALAVGLVPALSFAQFEITTGSGSTSQNFDSLLSSGSNISWTNGVTLDGWFLFQKDGIELTNYDASAGTSTTGKFFSFGSGSDRALGGLGSGGAYFGSPGTGAIAGWIAFAALNNSGSTLFEFTLQYDGEQWRNGGNADAQSLTLEYGFGDSFDTVLSWVPGGALFDFTSPVTGTTAGAIDGNTVGLVPNIGGVVTGLNWDSGETLWIRWADRNDPGNDHGLAIDNFSFAWAAGAAPLFWDPNLGDAGIGGAGTWSVGGINWNTDASGGGSLQAFDAASKAVFDGTGGEVQIDAAGVTANGGIEIVTPGYTIAGPGTLTIGSPNIDAKADATISAVIAGTSGVTKVGTGTLRLTAANEFQGTILLVAGALEVDNDSALGAAGNDIVLNGGVLATTTSFALNAQRNLTGGGSIAPADGTTLTVEGDVSTSNLDIAGKGTVFLDGASREVGAISFSDAGTLDAGGVVTATNITTTHMEGTATITADLDLGNALRAVDVADGAADIDLAITGATFLTGGTAQRLHKLGEGTLQLLGDRSSLQGGIRMGNAGASSQPGGRLIIDHPLGLGPVDIFDFQFNDGTLESLADLTGIDAIPKGISLGAGQIGPAVLAGSPMEFTGNLSFFVSSGNPITHRLQVDTEVTISGNLLTTASSGLSLEGSGQLTLAGLENTFASNLILNGPDLIVDGSIEYAAVTVQKGTFRYDGVLAGNLTVGDELEGDAIVDVGHGIGSITTGGLLLGADAVLRFQIDLTGALPAADQIISNGFTTIGSGFATLQLEVIPGGAALNPGDVFTIIDADTLDTFGEQFFAGLLEDTEFSVGGIPFRINYGVGLDGQDVTLTVVPEPATGVLALAGLGAVVGLARRRRR